MTTPSEVRPVRIEQRVAVGTPFPMPGLTHFLHHLEGSSGPFFDTQREAVADKLFTAIKFRLLTARFGLPVSTTTEGVFKIYEGLNISSFGKEKDLIAAESMAALHPHIKFHVFGDHQGMYCVVVEAKGEKEPAYATVTILDRPGEIPHVVAESRGKLTRGRRKQSSVVITPETIAHGALAKAHKKIS